MQKIGVVLDTNVIVSAHLSPLGLERFILDLALASKVQLYASEDILAEYAGVLARPKFRIAPHKLAVSLRLIRQSATILSPLVRLDITSDPDDNKFLESAEAACADYLVTGNKRHFPGAWKTTKVVNAREFAGHLIPHLARE